MKKYLLLIILGLPTQSSAQEQIAANELYSANEVNAITDKLNNPMVQCICNTNTKTKPVLRVRLRDDAQAADCEAMAGKYFPLRNLEDHDEIYGAAALLTCRIRIAETGYRELTDDAAQLEAVATWQANTDQNIGALGGKVSDELYSVRQDLSRLGQEVADLAARPAVVAKAVYKPVYVPAPAPRPVEPPKKPKSIRQRIQEDAGQVD